MYNILSTFLIFFYVLLVILIIYTLIHIIRYYENYGTIINLSLILSAIFIVGIIHSTLFFLSIFIYFSENVNIFLWKLAIIFGFISCGIASLIYSFLIQYKKIPIFPFLFYSLFFGFLIGSLFFPDSIQITYDASKSLSPHFITDISEINYKFNISTGFIIVIFHIFILIHNYYLTIILYINARDRKFSRGLLLRTFIFSIPMISYILYIILQLPIYRELYIISFWIYLGGICIILIKKPDIFFILTNKIYNLNIYHKSGILLYSHKFEKAEIVNDSAIWGNILIGINHILSEFIDKKDQIDVMQTKNADIVVNYNNEYGFAVLVITNKKNELLKNLMENFMNDFKERYKSELKDIQDLNKIINVSKFEDTKEIIEQNFKLFL
ncbi:MAG: hypothetical protein ACFFAN_18980 [Promethearchaeota archaeon]